ncbi:MAG: DUF542 domain-containing protein [Bacteroidia bacterium]
MTYNLARLAIHQPAVIPVFEKYGLDYYLNGHHTLQEACKGKKLDVSQIRHELSKLDHEPGIHIDVSEMEIENLIEFINNKFHSREKEVLTHILNQIQVVLKEETKDQSFVYFMENVEEIFSDLMHVFIRHCHREDQVLFPTIDLMLMMRSGKVKASDNKAPNVSAALHSLETDHCNAMNIFWDLKKCMDGFNIPPGASVNYIALIESLLAFEQELHMHLHLENNILFPKCRALKEELDSTLS